MPERSLPSSSTRIFEAEVRALSTDGTGVVNHPEGKVFFVPHVWPGDRAVFEIESEGPRYGTARAMEFKMRSPERAEVPCVHQGAGRCGGCPWMIGTYASQLKHKEHRVRHALMRAGLVSGPGAGLAGAEGEGVLKPIWGSEKTLGYRNRAQFKTDGKLLGFVEEKTNRIADVDDCLVINDDVRGRLRALRARLPEKAWLPGEGHAWNFIELDDAMAPGEEPRLNRRRPFRQGNSEQNRRMQGWLRERMPKASAGECALELFAGSGNFTGLFVEAGYARILAVEVAAAAMVQLRERHWSGVETLEADLSKSWVYPKIAKQLPDASVLLLDPPRDGARGVEKLVAELPKLMTVLSVSCDTATFVRDAVAISKKGFRLVEVQPLDLFPHTAHVEVLARFTR